MDIDSIEAYGFSCTLDVTEGLGTSWLASVGFERIGTGNSPASPALSYRVILDRSFATRLDAIDAARLFAVDAARRGASPRSDLPG